MQRREKMRTRRDWRFVIIATSKESSVKANDKPRSVFVRSV